jgi:hypothetical protein
VSEEANAYNAADPVELWKSWNETTTKMRSSMLDGNGEVYSSLFDLYCWWIKSGVLFKLWYNATYGIWVRMVGAVMCRSLQIPSWTEMAHVAKHIVALEERVYMLEDAFVNFEAGSLETTPGHQVVEGWMARQESPEGKLHTVDTLSTLLPHTTVVGELAERLERVEGKLERLLDALERIEARADAEATWCDKGGTGKTSEEA